MIETHLKGGTVVRIGFSLIDIGTFGNQGLENPLRSVITARVSDIIDKSKQCNLRASC